MLFNSVCIPQLPDCGLISVNIAYIAFTSHWERGQIIKCGDPSVTILSGNHIDKFYWHLFLFYRIYLFFLDLGKILTLDFISSRPKCVISFHKVHSKTFQTGGTLFISGRFSAIYILEICSGCFLIYSHYAQATYIVFVFLVHLFLSNHFQFLLPPSECWVIFSCSP